LVLGFISGIRAMSTHKERIKKLESDVQEVQDGINSTSAKIQSIEETLSEIKGLLAALNGQTEDQSMNPSYKSEDKGSFSCVSSQDEGTQ
jgi:predicted  nucleic acid-binding Zn-ribbon protein